MKGNQTSLTINVKTSKERFENAQDEAHLICGHAGT